MKKLALVLTTFGLVLICGLLAFCTRPSRMMEGEPAEIQLAALDSVPGEGFTMEDPLLLTEENDLSTAMAVLDCWYVRDFFFPSRVHATQRRREVLVTIRTDRDSLTLELSDKGLCSIDGTAFRPLGISLEELYQQAMKLIP